MDETRFFIGLGLVLAGALLGGALAQLLRQPLIVGYILGGVLVGRFTPGPTISDPHSFQLFAEVGVVLLLFTIGVEFSITELLRVGKVALYGAPAGIVLIVVLTLPVGRLLGWPTVLALAFAVIVVKFAVWSAVVRAAGYPAGTAAMAGLGLTQIGEFSAWLRRLLAERISPPEPKPAGPPPRGACYCAGSDASGGRWPTP